MLRTYLVVKGDLLELVLRRKRSNLYGDVGEFCARELTCLRRIKSIRVFGTKETIKHHQDRDWPVAYLI